MKTEELNSATGWDDWEYVLPGGDYSYYEGTVSVHDRSAAADITAERIARVDAIDHVSNQEYADTDMVCLVELADGTWAACMAWSDSSGWGCRQGVQWFWGITRDEVIANGLDREGRSRLNVPLDNERATS